MFYKLKKKISKQNPMQIDGLDLNFKLEKLEKILNVNYSLGHQ